eukprot:280642-Prymnesium_polylepis.1
MTIHHGILWLAADDEHARCVGWGVRHLRFGHIPRSASDLALTLAPARILPVPGLVRLEAGHVLAVDLRLEDHADGRAAQKERNEARRRQRVVGCDEDERAHAERQAEAPGHVPVGGVRGAGRAVQVKRKPRESGGRTHDRGSSVPSSRAQRVCSGAGAAAVRDSPMYLLCAATPDVEARRGSRGGGRPSGSSVGRQGVVSSRPAKEQRRQRKAGRGAGLGRIKIRDGGGPAGAQVLGRVDDICVPAAMNASERSTASATLKGRLDLRAISMSMHTTAMASTSDAPTVPPAPSGWGEGAF